MSFQFKCVKQVQATPIGSCATKIRRKNTFSEKEFERIRETVKTIKEDPEAMRQARMLAFSA